MMGFKLKHLAPENAGRYGYAYSVGAMTDYIAARVLLNTGLLLQGATIASTAVEKYLKVLLAARKFRTDKHLDQIDMDVVFETGHAYTNLRRDFFDLLGLVYQSRYVEDLKAPLIFGLEQFKLLAELDCTVHTLAGAVDVSYEDGRKVAPYQGAVDAKREALYQNNHILQKIDKADFLRTPGLASGFWIEPPTIYLEMRSHTAFWVATDDSSFVRTAATRNERTGQYDFSHFFPEDNVATPSV